jgi:hypothetical protein
MKRTIYSAILIFSFLIADAAAQTGTETILVSGNPALTESMIDKSREVFEFTFGGVFTDAEKSYFRSRLLTSWREQDAETIKAVQDLVAFRDKANGLSREQLLTLQKQLRDTLVKDLRAQAARDDLALALVNIHDRIQGLNAKQGGELPVPKKVSAAPQEQNFAEIPREILGEWIESKNVGAEGWEGSGGFTSRANGEKVIMHFFPDGTYKGVYHVQSSMSPACTMIVDIFSDGTYSVGTNILNLKEKSNRTISKDTCVERYNYDRFNQPKAYAYPAYIEPSENGTRLVLTMNDGKHHFYFNTGQSFLVK